MSGRGRKQTHRGGKSHRSQQARGAGPNRTAKGGIPAQRQQPPDRPGGGTRTVDTKPVDTKSVDRRPVTDVRPRRTPAVSPGAERAARRQQAERRKRNQRYGVVIGAVALGGAAIGGVIAGMAGAEPSTSSASSSPAASSAVAGPAGPTAPTAAATPAPAGLTITCPTGGGASPVFGHDIIVPEPYTITIDYGDGEVYTNDSANLGAIFSHTYADPGTYTVNAVLTLPEGATTSAACDYTW